MSLILFTLLFFQPQTSHNISNPLAPQRFPLHSNRNSQSANYENKKSTRKEKQSPQMTENTMSEDIKNLTKLLEQSLSEINSLRNQIGQLEQKIFEVEDENKRLKDFISRTQAPEQITEIPRFKDPATDEIIKHRTKNVRLSGRLSKIEAVNTEDQLYDTLEITQTFSLFKILPNKTLREIRRRTHKQTSNMFAGDEISGLPPEIFELEPDQILFLTVSLVEKEDYSHADSIGGSLGFVAGVAQAINTGDISAIIRYPITGYSYGAFVGSGLKFLDPDDDLGMANQGVTFFDIAETPQKIYKKTIKGADYEYRFEFEFLRL